MDIQAIGPRALLVLAPGTELRRWGVDPQQPERRGLCLLATEALRRRGLDPGRLSELRILTAPDSLLLLLRLEAGEEAWFPFPDLARAAEAVAALPWPPEGPLVWQEGRYLLREDSSTRSLSAFASPLSPEAAEAVERSAALVLDRRALARLWERLRR